MTFYHGTTIENWIKIKEDGLLHGIRNAPSRCTYLAVEKDHARYDEGPPEILLEVDYDPKRGDDNYQDQYCCFFLFR